jgi:hypothetical protein
LLETRTDDPFSGKEYGTKYVDKYVSELQKNVRTLIHNYRKYRPDYQKKENKVIGAPSYYPYGMSIRIHLRNLNTNKFKDGPTIENYTGSYHFTFTLPHIFPGSCTTLSTNHRYFANLIQWIEPLIASAYHSCDDRSVGEGDKYTKGSFRIVMSGWGDFGGADVRRIRCVKGRKKKTPVSEEEKEFYSLTRYSTKKVLWRNNLPFRNINLLAPCRDDLKSQQANTSLGTDFRTPYMRFPEKRKILDLQAIEVRIFDWFHPKHLQSLARLLVMVAERSRTHKVNRYVYTNKNWTKAVRELMIHGWNAKLPEGYIRDLEKVYGFEINPTDLRAHSVLKAFVKVLFEETNNGEWVKLLLKKKHKTPPTMPRVNRKSWEIAYVLFLMEHPKDFAKLKKFLKTLGNGADKNLNTLSATEVRKHFRATIGRGSNWMMNFDDIIGFLQTHGIVRTKHKYSGELECLTINKKRVSRINDLMKLWKYYLKG